MSYSFSLEVPLEDVFISGHHRIYFQKENIYQGVQAFKLPNIEFLEKFNSDDVVEYYHIELEQNFGYFVSELPVESYNMDV